MNILKEILSKYEKLNHIKNTNFLDISKSLPLINPSDCHTPISLKLYDTFKHHCSNKDIILNINEILDYVSYDNINLVIGRLYDIISRLKNDKIINSFSILYENELYKDDLYSLDCIADHIFRYTHINKNNKYMAVYVSGIYSKLFKNKKIGIKITKYLNEWT